ncbi:TPA: CesT family type III secretion system chaperone [Vibrio harveyi]|nr:CesT family type III secretion system chaperone [Vibrio harveyi]HDM8135724.1 CesT family type III secretion system chaperone [Vibrio harveyi]
MTTTFEYLVSSFFEKNGLESPIVKDGIYSLLINEKYQLHFTHQNEEWMVLYAELGEMNLISEQLAKSNIFGEYWPSHVVSHQENTAVLWSQQPIAMLNVAALEAWVECFIQDLIEKQAAISDVDPTPENTQPTNIRPHMISV